MLWGILFLAFEALNVYQPVVVKQSTPTKALFQQIFSIAALVAVVATVSQSLSITANTRLTVAESVSNPSPAEVAELFSRSARGDVAGLSCPCTAQSAPTVQVSNFTFSMDSYCTEIFQLWDPLNPSFSAFFQSLQDFPTLSRCIPREGSDYIQFAANVTALARSAQLFPDDSSFQSRVDTFAERLEASLCAMAFGLIPTQFSGNFDTAERMASACNDRPGFPFEDFVPRPFVLSATPAAFVPLQWSRTFQVFQSSFSTCSTLRASQQSFAAAARAAPLVTPTALSPSDLASAVERQFFSILDSYGGRTTGLVPGVVDSPIATMTDIPTAFSQVSGLLSTPLEIQASSFAFSSPLPFSRCDSISGGSQFFALASQVVLPGAVLPVRVPIITGEARLIARGQNADLFPYKERTRTMPFTRASGSEDSSIVPLGDDLLSLLDACADPLISLSVDLLSIRPFRLSSKYSPSSFIGDPVGQFFNYTSCLAGIPNTTDVGTPFLPTLFSTKLTCPAVLLTLAGARRRSSYLNQSSPLRVSFRSIRAQFSQGSGAGITALQFGNDLAERIQLLSTLFINSSGPVFSHSPLAHYAACAPASCSFVTSSPPTLQFLVLDAINVAGGTGSLIISFIGFLLWSCTWALRKAGFIASDSNENGRTKSSTPINAQIELQATVSVNPLEVAGAQNKK